jgi:hypothetical protein
MTANPAVRANHLIAPLADSGEDQWLEPAQLAPLVRRLLLFDRVTLETSGFREVPAMVEVFGFDGVMALLDSGALRFKRHGASIGEWATTGMLGPPENRVRLTSEFYAFGYISLPDFEQKKHNSEAFGEFTPRLGLNGKQGKKLRRAIGDRIISEPPIRGELLTTVRRGDLSLLRESIALVAADQFGTSIAADDLKLEVEHVPDSGLKHGDALFRAETNVGELAKVDAETERAIVQQGFFGVQGVDHRLSIMDSLEGVGGFRAREQHLFNLRFEAVLPLLDFAAQEESLTRVIEVAGLPDLSQGHFSVDVERLLEIRASGPAVALRNWLPTTNAMPDNEVAAMFNDLSEQVASMYQSKAGKAMRFIVSAGLDFLPQGGTIASLGFGALDSFVLENLAQPGPVSFLSDAYSAIYKPQST